MNKMLNLQRDGQKGPKGDVNSVSKPKFTKLQENIENSVV